VPAPAATSPSSAAAPSSPPDKTDKSDKTDKAVLATATSRRAPDRVPIQRRWWLWAAVGGVVVVGVAVGVGVALSTPHDAGAPPGAHQVSFPTVNTSF
jgi:hypothetical protein